ncbi:MULTISPECIES: hypothetical protein [Paraburkholderia]|uniref:hypothetical protein n=1 Tax=Paraburkholderia TaxID=1822464 RepID=UPI0038B9924F
MLTLTRFTRWPLARLQSARAPAAIFCDLVLRIQRQPRRQPDEEAFRVIDQRGAARELRVDVFGRQMKQSQRDLRADFTAISRPSVGHKFICPTSSGHLRRHLMKVRSHPFVQQHRPQAPAHRFNGLVRQFAQTQARETAAAGGQPQCIETMNLATYRSSTTQCATSARELHPPSRLPSPDPCAHLSPSPAAQQPQQPPQKLAEQHDQLPQVIELIPARNACERVDHGLPVRKRKGCELRFGISAHDSDCGIPRIKSAECVP